MGKVYLMLATPWDPEAEAETRVRFSTYPPNGTPPVYDGEPWPARLKNPPNMSVRVFDGEFGGAIPQVGNLQIDFGNGDLDQLTEYYWDGRDLTIYYGEEGADIATFKTIFNGTIRAVSWDRNMFTIELRDFAELLSKPLQQTLYDGSGGVEGPKELEGKPKPLAFGRPRNVEPIKISQAYLVYQVHSRTIAAIDGVFDRAVSLDFDKDYATFSTLINATISPGKYSTCLADGLLRLGGTPRGPLTVDVQGDSAGGFVETAADIFERLIVDFTDLVGSDLDQPSFIKLNDANDAPCSLYIPSPSADVRPYLDALMRSVGAFWTFTKTGKLKVRRVGFDSSVLTLTGAQIGKDISRKQVEPPIYRRKMAYNICWRVQGESEVNRLTKDDIDGLIIPSQVTIGIRINHKTFDAVANKYAVIHGYGESNVALDKDGFYFYGSSVNSIAIDRSQHSNGATVRTSRAASGYIVHDNTGGTPFTVASKKVGVVFVKFIGNKFSYDNGSGWSDLPEYDEYVVIGDMVTSSTKIVSATVSFVARPLAMMPQARATRNVWFRQTTEPSAAESFEGDFWHDTDDAITYEYDGTTWNVYSTVNHTYRQADQPSGGKIEDLWFETDTGKVWRHDGGGWDEIGKFVTKTSELSDDAGLANNRVFRQSTAPSNPIKYDLWHDTDANPAVISVYTGTSWVIMANLVSNTDELTDGANLGDTANWSDVSGTGKPQDFATNSYVFYQSTTPSGAKKGDLWVETDQDPVIIRRYSGSSWATVANLVRNTDELTDGARLGKKADWGSVSGTGKPESYATKSRVFYQTSAPSGPVRNDIWYDTNSNPRTMYKWSGSSWVAVATLNTGAMANKDSVDTPDIDDRAVTDTDSLKGTKITMNGWASYKVVGINRVEFVKKNGSGIQNTLSGIFRCTDDPQRMYARIYRRKVGAGSWGSTLRTWTVFYLKGTKSTWYLPASITYDDTPATGTWEYKMEIAGQGEQTNDLCEFIFYAFSTKAMKT